MPGRLGEEIAKAFAQVDGYEVALCDIREWAEGGCRNQSGKRVVKSSETERKERMDTSSLMEQILSSDNLNRAYLQVVRNKGAEGVDGVKYTELKEHLAKNGENIKEQLRARKYKPQPVRRVEIPKPDGGVRNLGVPTVTDRFVQQAIAQVLTPIYEEQFHDHSYGFRPNRCAQQAILTALEMMNDGNEWIVDIDLDFDSQHDSTDKVLSYDRDNISIFNSSAYDSHELIMIYCVKELFQVDVYNPLITVIHHFKCC